MNQQLTITREFHINRRHHGRKQFRDGMAPDVPVGRVPRIARLMALALRCERLIRDGVMTDQSELARFAQITTSRMTQIMSLLNLAPDLQEQILFLPRNERGRRKPTSGRSPEHSISASSGGNGRHCGRDSARLKPVGGKLASPLERNQVANK
jgi:hypothetical protein